MSTLFLKIILCLYKVCIYTSYKRDYFNVEFFSYQNFFSTRKLRGVKIAERILFAVRCVNRLRKRRHSSALDRKTSGRVTHVTHKRLEIEIMCYQQIHRAITFLHPRGRSLSV